MVDVRKAVGEEVVEHFFSTRVINQKLKKNVPDGIYDFTTERGLSWREVIINGTVMYTMTKSWLDNGGPEHLSDELRAPWGTYGDYNAI